MTARLAAALRVSCDTIHRKFPDATARPSARSACHRLLSSAGVMSPSTCSQAAEAGAGRSCKTRNSCCHDLGG
eukprot:5897403-Alexandrium_andersonii.AAC.1